MGTIVIGKVESGCCKKGESLLIMPNKVRNIEICSEDDNKKVTIIEGG